MKFLSSPALALLEDLSFSRGLRAHPSNRATCLKDESQPTSIVEPNSNRHCSISCASLNSSNKRVHAISSKYSNSFAFAFDVC